MLKAFIDLMLNSKYTSSFIEMGPNSTQICEKTSYPRDMAEMLKGLTFADVTIRPQRTSVSPEEVNLRHEVLKGLITEIPILSAPMETVWSIELSQSLSDFGGVAPICRDLGLSDIESVSRKMKEYRSKREFLIKGRKLNSPPIIATSSPFDKSRIKFLLSNKDIDYLILDSVQPFNDTVIRNVEQFSEEYPDKIVVGNIATEEAAKEFLKYKVAGLKVGLGPGSICTTRKVTGIGVPQLQAISEVAELARPLEIPVIADGGIRELGDIAKALAAGASSVMMGRMFSGTLESPSEVKNVEGKKYKFYAGSTYNTVEYSSESVHCQFSSFLEELGKSNHRVEGVSGYVPYAGPVEVVAFQIKRSLSASLAFVGAKNIRDFWSKARFIKMSPASFNEGNSHSIEIVTHRNKIFS